MRFVIPPRRAARRSMLLLATILLATPTAALAAHQFFDVPNGHPFHTEIGAIADAGITAGFGDGGYHPSAAVTRQAMAAFMHRGFGRVGQVMNASLINPTLTVDAGEGYAPAVPIRAIQITVPGQTSGFTPEQMVYVQGRVVLNTTMGTSDAMGGCPCEFFAAVRDVDANALSYLQRQTFWVDAAYAINSTFTFDVEAVFVAPPGPRSFQLEVGLGQRRDTSDEFSFALDVSTSISAMTFPFGPSGGNTIN
jgi:hypothetical protein